MKERGRIGKKEKEEEEARRRSVKERGKIRENKE